MSPVLDSETLDWMRSRSALVKRRASLSPARSQARAALMGVALAMEESAEVAEHARRYALSYPATAGAITHVAVRMFEMARIEALVLLGGPHA